MTLAHVGCEFLYISVMVAAATSSTTSAPGGRGGKGGRARTTQEAENRLAHFNAERDAIVAEVSQRVVSGRLSEAQRHKLGDASLEYVLNDVAFQEIRRLERGPASAGEKKRLGAWKDLARRVGRMTDDEKRAELTRIVEYYARDVCGNFNPRVFKFATSLLPMLL